MSWAQPDTTTTVAEAVSNSDWGASEWIALVAALGTILAVCVTGMSIFLSYRQSDKRLTHEKELQTEKFAEERRAATLQIAAVGYQKAKDVQREITLHRVERRAADSEFGMGDGSRAVVLDAKRALEVVAATGWTEDVRSAASLVIRRIDGLESTAFSAVGGLQRSPRGTEIEDRVTDAEEVLAQAIRQYRAALDE